VATSLKKKYRPQKLLFVAFVVPVNDFDSVKYAMVGDENFIDVAPRYDCVVSAVMLPAGIAVKSLGMVSNPSQIVAEIGAILACAHKDGPPLPASPPPPPAVPAPASVSPVPVTVEVLVPPELAALELPPAVVPPAELLAPELGATELPPALELGAVDVPVPVPVPVDAAAPVFVSALPVDEGAALVEDEALPTLFVLAPGTLLSDEHAAMAATIGTAKHPNTDGTWKDLVNRILVTLFR
jgi:hypothetical protein